MLKLNLLCLAGLGLVMMNSLPASPEDDPVPVRRIDGYRGIWFDLGQRSEYGSKYSGGLGTYTAKHHPLAVYAPAVNKTFFVYGGTTEPDERHLLAMISCYDHATGLVPEPVVVYDKNGVDDPHDDPSLQIDEDGHLWVFVSGRGRTRPGFIYRSLKPYDINGFERILEDEFTYPQPWVFGHTRFLQLFTRYSGKNPSGWPGRELYWRTSSPDGRQWGEAHKLAGMGGHYQMSNQRDNLAITAFNWHPDGKVDERTNLYFLQTDDLGQTWKTAEGTVVETPLTEPHNPALVHDYKKDGRLVYLKDIGFDREGHPVLLYITSAYYQPGPKGDPRIWTIARWTGEKWTFSEVTQSTANYDMGSLFIDPEGDWRIIAPTEAGPQHWGTGGEIALWRSTDQGTTWEKVRDVTRGGERNHGYVRRVVNGRKDFAAFWADGNTDQFSQSHLYFTNRDGTVVRELPYIMEEDFAVPAIVRFDEE